MRDDDVPEKYRTIGVVPELRSRKKEDETWIEFSRRLDVPTGAKDLRKWVRQDWMPKWRVQWVKSHLRGDGDANHPKAPPECSPIIQASKRQGLMDE